MSCWQRVTNPKFEEIQCTDKNTGLASDFKIRPKSEKQNRRDELDNEQLQSSKKDENSQTKLMVRAEKLSVGGIRL